MIGREDAYGQGIIASDGSDKLDRVHHQIPRFSRKSNNKVYTERNATSFNYFELPKYVRVCRLSADYSGSKLFVAALDSK